MAVDEFKTKAEIMHERSIATFGRERIDEAYACVMKDIEMAADRGETKIRLPKSLGLPNDTPMYNEVVKRLRINGFNVLFSNRYGGVAYVVW